MFYQIENKRTRTFLTKLTLIILFVFFFFNNILDTVNNISYSGYSQIEAVNLLSGELADNPKAYESTAEAKRNSVLTWVYFSLFKFFKIEPLNLIYVFKIIEILTIFFSTKFLLSSLEVKNTLNKSVLYLAIPVLSTVGYKNWANYGQIFTGEWYQLPHYLYFFCIGFILRKKYINSIFTLLAIFLLHPSKGIAFIISTGPIILYLIYKNKDKLNMNKVNLSIIVSTIISLLFTYFVISSTATTIEDHLWESITKVHNWHILMGNFNLYFIVVFFFPTLILSYGIYRRLESTDLKYLGFSLFTISLIGKIYDVFGNIPEILKLTMHRTTENIILISILLILSQFKKLDYKIRILELGSFYLLIYQQNVININHQILLLGFIYFLILIYFKDNFEISLPLIFYLILFENLSLNSNVFYFLLFCLSVVFMNYEKFNHLISLNYLGPFLIIYLVIIKLSNLIGLNFFNFTFLILYVAGFLFMLLLFYKLRLKNFLFASIFALTFSILIFVNIANISISSKNLNYFFSQKTNGYYEAQIWSKNNTYKDAIFFPDPTISYAWRDFSERNSFGTPREFVTTWVYSQKNYVFQDAVNRLSIFVDNPVDTMLSLDKSEFINHISQIYYSSEIDLYKELVDEWEVSYFLWNKNYALPSFFEVIFETDTHFILILN